MMASRLSSQSLYSYLLLFLLTLAYYIQLSNARKHHLSLTNENRKYIKVSKFGFMLGGQLNVNLDRFSFTPFHEDSVFGFTLAKTMSDSLTPYLEGQKDRCLLLDEMTQDDNIGLVRMVFDLKNNITTLSCNNKLRTLRLYDEKKLQRSKREVRHGVKPYQELKPDTNQTNNEALKSLPVTNKSVKKEEVEKPDIGSPKVNQVKNENQINTNNEKQKVEVKEGKSQQDKPADVKVGAKSPVEEIKKVLGPDSENDSHPDDHVNSKENEKVQPEKDGNIDIDNQPEPNYSESKMNLNENKMESKSSSCVNIKTIVLTKHTDTNTHEVSYSFHFQMTVAEESHEGLYSLFFHNCPNYGSHGGFRGLTLTNLSMFIEERNLDNFLSAGEIPLPQLFFALSVIFFLLGIIWIHLIRHKKEDTFKIHYLMALLVFVKAFSLLFHSINFHFIAKTGSHVETWAILYYLTHLLKGALLFITMVLIGTGWAFIKHILSDKDKKIFMIVIPLQVIANIADIIVEESEEGELKHIMWREIFILVDLLCCGAILFPVVWSIRHLQEASQTDGKAAINLIKLKLFRHFYVMIVCYIYFTRIIVYILKITVPFEFEWLEEFFKHAATLAFFILTGYYFQPTATNPYFQLSQDDDELEMEEVLFIQPNSFGETKKRTKDLEKGDGGFMSKREIIHDFD